MAAAYFTTHRDTIHPLNNLAKPGIADVTLRWPAPSYLSIGALLPPPIRTALARTRYRLLFEHNPDAAENLPSSNRATAAIPQQPR